MIVVHCWSWFRGYKVNVVDMTLSILMLRRRYSLLILMSWLQSWYCYYDVIDIDAITKVFVVDLDFVVTNLMLLLRCCRYWCCYYEGCSRSDRCWYDVVVIDTMTKVFVVDLDFVVTKLMLLLRCCRYLCCFYEGVRCWSC